MQERTGRIGRKTKETDLSVTLDLDGTGKVSIETGVGFFDHMLEGFARHGLFDLSVYCKGDLHVDPHHTVEDTGIVIGRAIKEAIGNKEGIKRFGYFILPMDESLLLCSLDLSGRPYLSFDVSFERDRVGDMDTELVKEFFHAVAYGSNMTLHIKQLSGQNTHHIIEAIFKAFGKALDEATRLDDRIQGVLSTKGAL